MDYSFDNINDLEHIKLKTLANTPINLKDIGLIHPIKLSEITNISEGKYNQYLGYLCISVDNINVEEKVKKEMKEKNINSFLLILSQCIQDNGGSFLSIIKDAFNFFLKKEIIFVPEISGFFIGNIDELKTILNELKTEDDLKNIESKGFITEKNYEEFKLVLMLQNCLEVKVEKEEKYANDKAKKIAEQIKEAKEKVNKVKSKQGASLSLFDLISAFSAYSNSLNILNVWDLNIFQFNDQFKRLQMIEEYDINIRSLLAGADSKKINLEHWTKKIKND